MQSLIDIPYHWQHGNMSVYIPPPEGGNMYKSCVLCPGLVDCLTGLHKWPHGLDAKEEKWLPQATQVTRDIMEKHARDARNRGISPHEHVRKILDAPG